MREQKILNMFNKLQKLKEKELDYLYILTSSLLLAKSIDNIDLKDIDNLISAIKV